MNNEIHKIKEELMNAAKKLLKSGVLYRGEHANLSAKTSDGNIVMTKGGEIGNINVDSFAVINFEGQVVEGEMESVNAEVVEMHTAIYKTNEAAGAVIHTHAPNITAFSIAHQSIPVVYEPMLRFGIKRQIPVVQWAPRGSRESVNGIEKVIQEYPDLNAVMLANHGVLAFHSDPLKTAQLIITLDEAAELIIKARILGREKTLPEKAFEKVKKRIEQFQK